jgi:hypothetical protein
LLHPRSKLPRYHPNVDDDALDRAVRDLRPLMSNAKWVRLLGALSAEPDVVVQCGAKLVWSDAVHPFRIAGASYRFNYYDDSMESMIAGPSMGWHRYKEIEWIEFPARTTILVDENNRKAGTREVEQDLASIRSRIESVGVLELRDEHPGLRLYAYLR